jgi:hypothetical protein
MGLDGIGIGLDWEEGLRAGLGWFEWIEWFWGVMSQGACLLLYCYCTLCLLSVTVYAILPFPNHT